MVGLGKGLWHILVVIHEIRDEYVPREEEEGDRQLGQIFP